MELQANYVWSRNLDTLTGNAGADFRGSPTIFMNPFDRMADKSLSGLDTRHNFSTNYLYDFPSVPFRGVVGQLSNGWSLGGILTLSTGVPLTPLMGFCRSNATVNCGEDRPSLAPGADNNPVLGDPNRYFDTTAFTLPAAGFFGNLGRNTVIGPGFASLDFSFYKKFKIGEGRLLQFRAEMFNFLNCANFALPDSNLFTSTGARVAGAGVITRTVTTNREIQFGLRFSF